MDKFLLVLFFLIKIIVIIIVSIVFYIFKNRDIKKFFIVLELLAISIIGILYIMGFSYVVDSNITNMMNLKLLSDSDNTNSSSLYSNIEISNSSNKLEGDNTFRTHRNGNVYYFNGSDMPLAARKVSCENGYDYYKYYSDMITSTAMLLSTYFDKNISPLDILSKVEDYKLVKCGEPINEDAFFYMIYNEYKVNFIIISNAELKNYVLNGKPVLLETNGNGNLSCTQSYFLIYDINNKSDYLMLDPNNKSYSYICTDGSSGFGNILKPNYNESTFSDTEIFSDTRRLIVIGGTR